MGSRSHAIALAASLWGCGEDGLRPAPAPVCEGVFASGSALIPLAPAAFHRLPIGLGIPADTAVLIRRLPEGFRASVIRGLSDGQLFLEVRVPASASGEVTLELETRCGGEATPLPLRSVILPPAWRSGPSWKPGESGPTARRGPQLFVGPERLGGAPFAAYVYGGTGDAGPLGDLFGLDRPDEPAFFGEIPQAGEPPEPREGARIHMGAEGNPFGLLYGGRVRQSGEEGESFVAPPGVHRLELGGPSAFFQPASVEQNPARPGDFEPAFVVDSVRNVAISACGWNEAEGTHCRARIFDPNAATFRDLEIEGPAPEGRFGAAFALDGDRLVVFGGDRSEPGGAPDVADDVWALLHGATPPRWIKLGEAPGLGRRGAAFVLDAPRRRLLVWGGTRDGETPLPGLYALALDRFAEGLVEELPTEGPPPEPRVGGAAAFWPLEGAEGAGTFVFGFGEAGGELLADLWLLDARGSLLPAE